MSTVVEAQPMDAAINERVRAWARTLKLGQEVRIKDLYNASERPPNRIPAPCRARGIRASASQTGVMILVKRIDRSEVWLDASWFEVGS